MKNSSFDTLAHGLFCQVWQQVFAPGRLQAARQLSTLLVAPLRAMVVDSLWTFYSRFASRDSMAFKKFALTVGSEAISSEYSGTRAFLFGSAKLVVGAAIAWGAGGGAGGGVAGAAAGWETDV
jgi:hypothetical protein